MCLKHKVGDKVKIRPDLRYDEEYDGQNVNEEMIMSRGEEVTISEVFAEDLGYEIEEDDGQFFWTDAMFEDAMTNADKIRSMSDEELAEFLSKVTLGAASRDVWTEWLTSNKWER